VLIDPALVGTAFLLGGVIGLTGMGGGALMTPLLIGVFNVPPAAAIASDLVASAIMKPFGAAVHLRSGTADLRIVRWLLCGSVPSAFAAPILSHALIDGGLPNDLLRVLLGVLVVASSVLGLARAFLNARRPPEHRSTGKPGHRRNRITLCVLGVVVGTLVGLTSVGSGSLVAAGLVVLFPAMTGRRLTATDLVQAVPLVWAAALGHLLVGEFALGITASVALGGIPGVIVGSLWATRVRGRWLKAFVLGLLMFSGLSMLSAPLWAALPIAATAGTVHWFLREKPPPEPASSVPAASTIRSE